MERIRNFIDDGAIVYKNLIDSFVEEFSAKCIQEIDLSSSEYIFLLLGYQKNIVTKSFQSQQLSYDSEKES